MHLTHFFHEATFFGLNQGRECSHVRRQQKRDTFRVIVNGHIEACSCLPEAVNYMERGRHVQEISGKLWQAEARSAETNKVISGIKRVICR